MLGGGRLVAGAASALAVASAVSSVVPAADAAGAASGAAPAVPAAAGAPAAPPDDAGVEGAGAGAADAAAGALESVAFGAGCACCARTVAGVNAALKAISAARGRLLIFVSIFAAEPGWPRGFACAGKHCQRRTPCGPGPRYFNRCGLQITVRNAEVAHGLCGSWGGVCALGGLSCGLRRVLGHWAGGEERDRARTGRRRICSARRLCSMLRIALPIVSRG